MTDRLCVGERQQLTALCLWVSSEGEGEVLAAGRFEMRTFHSLLVVGFEVTENDREKSAGGRQLKPPLCVSAPPGKLLQQDVKPCLCPCHLFSLSLSLHPEGA